MFFTAKILRKIKKKFEFGPSVSEIGMFKVLVTTMWDRVQQKTQCCFF